MTQDELDDLPELDLITWEKITLPDPRYPEAEGRFLNIPKIGKTSVMTTDESDFVLIKDRKGRFWSTGKVNGILHKQRAPF